MPGSVAENIRCFSPENPDRYAAVVRATALEADLAAMPPGARSSVDGENLSGGQRQRVALARPVRDADVYLLDDPSPARSTTRSPAPSWRGCWTSVSPAVPGLWRPSLDVARRADRVVVLDGGRVVAAGPLAEVAARMPELLPAVTAGESMSRSAPDAGPPDEPAEEIVEEGPGRAGPAGPGRRRHLTAAISRS